MRLKRWTGGFYTTEPVPNRRTPPFSSELLSSLPLSCGGWLVDPYALPYDFLTPLLDVVPWVSSGPISAGATGDEVLAPIHSIDIVVPTLTVRFVGAAAKVQRVAVVPSSLYAPDSGV
jgi:hypothetical protein